MRVLFVQGSNPAATCPNQSLVHEGLSRPDLFTVVHEQVLTDTARYADVVLPATTSFEVYDLVAGYGGYVVQDAPAAIPPVGASRSNNEVAHGLALRLGLAHRDLDKFPHQLSGGMQSRVALARALVLAPELLLLDEPFSALDVGLKEELYRLLLDHQAERGMGVLMITHDLMEAVRLSDAILVMAPEPGRIVGRFELDRPAARRDDAWVYRHTAELLQTPDVRMSFGLPPVVAVEAEIEEPAQWQDAGRKGGPAGPARGEPLSGLRLVSPASGLVAVQGGKRCGA